MPDSNSLNTAINSVAILVLTFFAGAVFGYLLNNAYWLFMVHQFYNN